MKKMKKRSKAERLASTPLQRSWRERLHQACVPLVVCGLALAVYSRSLFCGFVRDDLPQIVNNPQVQSWQYLPQILTSHLWSQFAGYHALFYRPLFSLWMLVIHTLGGLSPWFWHLSSILLHVVCTYLVYRLMQRLIGSEAGAGLAAALFAVHPIHVDAVSWVSASNEILFSILTLGAMLVLLKPHERGDRWPIFLSAILYFTGLFAKETGVTLIVLLIAMAWMRVKDRERSWSQRLLLTGSPYVAATGAYLIIRWSVMHGVGVENGEHSWRDVFFTSPSIMLFYLRKLIVPVGLSGGYVNPIHPSPTMAFWLPLAAIVLLVLLMTWLAFRMDLVFGFSAALILLPLLLALAGIRLYPQGDMTHDRYLYLPSVGLCLLIGAMARRMLEAPGRARTVSASVFAILLVAFFVLTFTQQRFYHDDFAFLQREIEVSPTNSFAYGLLGNVYMGQGRTDLGLKNYRIASELASDDPRISLFLVRGLVADRKYTEAEGILNRLMLRKDFDAGRQNAILLSLANAEIGLGKLDSAQQLLQHVEQADPNFPELHWALGVLDQRHGQISLAQAEFEKEYQITGDELAHRESVKLLKQTLSRTPPSAGSRY
jgi:tetratricopeptide (TPR) repeat protein